MATHDPSAASARIAGSRPGTRSPASHLTTASSATVTATAGPRKPPAKTTTETTSSTTAAASQPTPVVWRWRGNGGGCPEGRRRRGERLIPACSCEPRAAAARAGGFAGTSITPPTWATARPHSGTRQTRQATTQLRHLSSQPLVRRPIHRSASSVTVATDRRHRGHGDTGEELRDAGAGDGARHEQSGPLPGAQQPMCHHGLRHRQDPRTQLARQRTGALGAAVRGGYGSRPPWRSPAHEADAHKADSARRLSWPAGASPAWSSRLCSLGSSSPGGRVAPC